MRASGGEPSGDRPAAGVPAELLRAGVYVPGTRATLEGAVRRAREEGAEDGRTLDQALRARLAADPVLLEEAVRRMADRIRSGDAASVAVARAGDLLLAAPVAREAGVPLRILPASGSASAPGWPPSAGERCAAVAPVAPREETRDRVRERLRDSGAVPAGWLAVAADDPRGAGECWCATNPAEGTSNS